MNSWSSINSTARHVRRCFAATLVTVAIGSLSGQSPGPSTPMAGEDWSFPFPVSKEAYSGIYRMGPNSTPDANGLVTNIGRTLSWASLNPKEDVYDFSYLDGVLATAKNATPSYGVVLRLKCSILESNEQGQGGTQVQMIPQWVLDKYGITAASHGGSNDIGYRDNDTFHTDHNKLYVAPWHPGVQAEYLKFVAEFGRRKYLQSPQVLGVYVHGVSSSAGEEMDIEEAHPIGSPWEDWVDQAANTVSGSGYGSLGAAITGYLSQRITGWANAAGSSSYKLIWVGAGSVTDVDSAYDAAALNSGALGLGLGHRGGFIEHYYYPRIHPPKAEQTFTASGHMSVDWGVLSTPGYHTLLDGMRFWGDENEEVDEYDERLNDDDYTPQERVKKLMYRSSYFRAAATGMNFLWTETNPIGFAGGSGGIPGWFTKVAGKGPNASPDAVAWLREAKVRGLGVDFSEANAKAYKNMERMLLQRDDDSVAVATSTLPTAYVQVKKKSDPDEAFSRRTNRAAGHRKISFRLDPTFKASLKAQAQPVQIKVTYREESSSYRFMVRVAQGSSWASLGTVTAAANSTAEEEDRWKTVTCTLTAGNLATAFVAGSALGGGAEFDVKLFDDANVDMHVRYVRVVRTDEVPQPPAIKIQPMNIHVLPNQTATLQVIAKGPNLTYQWKKNGANVAGATLAYLDRGYADHGNYSVVVSNINGSDTSVTATLSQAYNAVLDNFSDGAFAPWTEDPQTTPKNVTLTTPTTSPSPEGNNYLQIVYASGLSDWKYARWISTASAFGSTWSTNGANAIRFYIRGNHSGMPHNEIRFQLREGTSGERWSASVGNFVQNNAWSLVTIPFSTLYKDPDSPTANNTFDLSAIDQIRLYHKGSTSRTIHIDKVEVIKL